MQIKEMSRTCFVGAIVWAVVLCCKVDGTAVAAEGWRYVQVSTYGPKLLDVCPTMAVGEDLHALVGIPPRRGSIRTHKETGSGVIYCVNGDGSAWAGERDAEATIWRRGVDGTVSARPLGIGAVHAIHGSQLGGLSQYGHAMLWLDSTEEGFVDLAVRRAQTSMVTGTIGSSQVGWALFGRPKRWHVGVIWHSNARFGYYSPLGDDGASLDVRFTCVEGVGTDAGIGGAIWVARKTPHALLGIGNLQDAPTGPNPRGMDITQYKGIRWHDLHPDGAQSSMIVDASGSRQVGYAVVDGYRHAAVWSGSPDTFVDLHEVLAATGDGWLQSWAHGVYADGDEVWLVGAGSGADQKEMSFLLYGKGVLPNRSWRAERAPPVVVTRSVQESDRDIVLPSTDALLCYYPLNDAIGRRCSDATGNTRDAVYRGASPGDACGAPVGRLRPVTKSLYADSFPSLVPGLFGRALRSYGGGYQDVLKREGVNFGKGDFTISFWVNPTAYNRAIDFGGGAGRGCVVRAYARSSPKQGLAIFLDDAGRVNLSMLDETGARMISARTPAKNHWTHLAFVVRRNEARRCRIYMNGEPSPLDYVREAADANDYDLDGALLIGQSLIGDVDDFTVYSRALDHDEVRVFFELAPKERLLPPRPAIPTKYLGKPIRSPQRPYRIIYNMDSSGILYGYESVVEKTVPEYLRSIADFLETTHVDMVSWCDGSSGNAASWDSDVMELTGARIGSVDPFLLQLIKEGYDPARIVIPAIRKMGVDVFYSFRFNDIHDNLGNHPELLPTFKMDHPEWTLGEGHPYGGRLQLNFARPEVRDFKFSVVKDVFDKHDFDGLEIDFLRSPPYFIPGQEAENAHFLTSLLRRIRGYLRERGEERGRPIGVLVRVDESLDGCRLDGFDVATWIQEDLIDMIALGSGSRDIRVEEFKALTAGTDIRVYACPYAYKTEATYYGLATNYLSQGADGLYTFNWGTHYSHVEGSQHMQYQRRVLGVMDEINAMRGRNKTFAADTGTPRWQYPHNWLHTVLPLTVTTEAPGEAEVPMWENFSCAPEPLSIELTVKLSGSAEIDVTINDSRVSKLWRAENVMTAPLQVSQLIRGRNRVRFSVTEGEVIVSGVEIDVVYSETSQ